MNYDSVGLQEMGSVTAPDGVSFTAPYHSLFILHPLRAAIHSEADHLMLLLANHLIHVAEVCALEQMVPTQISVYLIRCNKICGKFVCFVYNEEITHKNYDRGLLFFWQN